MFNYIITEDGVFPTGHSKSNVLLLDDKDLLELAQAEEKRLEFLKNFGESKVLVSCIRSLDSDNETFIKYKVYDPVSILEVTKK